MPDADVTSRYVTPGAAFGDAGGTCAVGGSRCAAIAAAAIATKAAAHGTAHCRSGACSSAPSQTSHAAASRRRSCDTPGHGTRATAHRGDGREPWAERAHVGSRPRLWRRRGLCGSTAGAEPCSGDRREGGQDANRSTMEHVSARRVASPMAPEVSSESITAMAERFRRSAESPAPARPASSATLRDVPPAPHAAGRACECTVP